MTGLAIFGWLKAGPDSEARAAGDTLTLARIEATLELRSPSPSAEKARSQLKAEGQSRSLTEAMTEARFGVKPVQGTGQAPAVWAQNPAHGLNCTFSTEGLRFTVRQDESPSARLHNVGWRLVSVGCGQQQHSVPAGMLRAAGQRVELTRSAPPITEWFNNKPDGLEHGFTLAERPAAHPGDEPLQLFLAVTGDLIPHADADGQSLELRDADGKTILTYARLKVWDATGTELSASMQAANGQVTLVVQDANARYPLTIDPTFTQTAYLKASNTGGDDTFGSSVAISGNTVVVGAPGEASNGTGVNPGGAAEADNSAYGSGAVYVFVRDNLGNWTQQAYLKASNSEADDRFGSSVAISGDTVVVGALVEDSSATGVNHPTGQSDNSADGSGAAYVFVRNGATWSQQAYLKPSNTDAGDRFGWAVSVSGDTVVVGAYGEASDATGVNAGTAAEASNGAQDSGAAYVFVRSGTTWSQQAYLKASNTDAFDYFGRAVSVSGDTVVVGAYAEDSNGSQSDNSATDSGALYVFVRSGAIWTQQAYLKAGNSGADDWFGYCVAISGDTIMAGALQEDSSATGVNGPNNNSAPDSGAAYVFTRSGTTWTQQAYLKASNTGAGDNFGYAVSVAGDTGVVGARFESSSFTGVNPGPTAEADNSSPLAGAAYLFTRSGATWSQQAYLKASNTDAYDYFGESVAASDGTVVVGAFRESSSATGVNGNQSDNSASAAGAVYIFADLCTSTNLLVNGSFEDGTFTTNGDDCQTLPNGSSVVSGWTVSLSHAARCQSGVLSGVTASHGTKLIDLTGYDNVEPHAGVTQTVPTTTGQCYRLSFDLGVNPQGAGTGGPITVRAQAGSSGWRTFTHNPSGPGTQWSTYGFSFTASSASTAITIEGLSANPYFIGLDNVVLTRSCDCTNNSCAISIVCPPNLTVSNAPGLCSAVVNYPAPILTESCGANVTVTCTPPSGSTFPVGTNTVTCTATNLAGQSNTCSFLVLVRDAQPPQVICDTNELRVPLVAGCQLRIPQIRPAATDNCTAGRRLLYTQDPAAGTLVPGPCAAVTIIVTDEAGNAAICVRQVCGKDRTPPQLMCPPGSLTVSNCQVPALLGLASATDHCTASNLLTWTQSPPAGTPINVPTWVTITVTDAAGNFATCRTLVTPVGGPCQPCVPPTIKRQPVDQRFTVGATVVFSVSASGTGPLTYQWYRGFAPLSNGGRYSGVNTPLLRVNAINSADAGRYYCVVSNPCGTATTRSAWLYVWPVHPWPFAEWTFADLGNPFSAEVGAALLFSGATNQFTVASSEDLGLPDPAGVAVNVLSTPGFTGGSSLTLPSIMPSNVTSLANYTVVMDVFVATGASNQTHALFANRPGTNSNFQWTMISGDPLPTVPGVPGQLTADGVVMAAPSGQWNRVALVVSTESGTARVSTYVNGENTGDTDLGLAGDPIPGIDVRLDQNPGGGIIATPIGGRTNSGNSELHLAGVQFHSLALAPETLASLGRPGAGLSVTELGNKRPGPPLESQASAGSLMIAWPDRSRLERTPQLGSPWLEVLNVVSPYSVPLQGPAGFYRLREEPD